MAMVLPRIGALQRAPSVRRICVQCAVRQRQAVCLLSQPAVRSLLFGGRRSLSSARILKAVASAEVEDDELTGRDPRFASESEIFQHAEIETYRDIRGYLRKWQETNPNTLDPVQDLDTEDVSEIAKLQVGCMMNGRDPSENPWSISKLSHQEDLDTSDDFEGEHLEPGDLVARLSADGLFKFAIYVKSVYRQKQFYTEQGNWRICSDREIDYVVKGFAPPHLLDPIRPYFPDRLVYAKADIQSTPEGGLPRPLGAPLLQMMLNFKNHILDFYQTHSSELDNMYDVVADDSEFLRLTLEELATRVLGIDESELNSVNTFAVHQAIRRDPFLIEKDVTSMFRETYLIQPKRISKVVDQVTTWVHEHQDYCIRAVMAKETPGLKDHPIRRFIQKAQRMIRLSRKVRSPTIMSSVGPSSQRFKPGQDDKPLVYREVLTESFTNSDQTIIEYLQLYAIPGVIMPSGTLKTTASHIMRETGMYNVLGITESSTRLFLQELGVVAPWENLSLLDPNLLLPGHGVSLLEDMRWEEMEETCENMEPLTDSMQHLRQDWGDMPVYCVDDVTAQEIDDGVSLERIPDSDKFWVHIHVANPTAFLERNHPVVEYAASRFETTYVPERTYPIFPRSLTQDRFSLADGRPTLTFSAMMNLQGEILDTKIVNGTIRNVISVTHQCVREFLNPDLKESPEPLIVGGTYVNPPLPREKTFRRKLSPEDKETFAILSRLMLAFREQRQKGGAMDLPSLRPNTSISVQMGTTPPRPYEMQVTEGRYFVGDPVIQLRMHDFDPHEVRDQSKDYLISLLMNLAGHISGQFCASRNLPVVYNGTWYDPEYGRVTRQNLAEFGGESFYHLTMPKALSSSSPIRHHIMGFDAYVKSTSPLRRFTDVIAHYQIEAALRFEAEHGRQLDATTDIPDLIETVAEEPAETKSESEPESESYSPAQPTSLLPYTKKDLDTHISSSQSILARLKQVSTFSARHWACMLLFRAFYFGECTLPSSFPVLLRTPRLVPPRDGTVYSGVITNLGIDCVVTIPDTCPDKDKMDIFGVVNASITAVDMATLEVKMQATGFVKAFSRTGAWA
ncbi:uncharacterized protein N7459_006272 [Penicillium hispanicum]|uniref:uncharacterized protein n=1 Tax=Penicillium hispanicum TaxID=1080232 RepID=UPI002540F040|nr:uncharacterized protein N7459_006272 [Penicillium hispanicum]KAJ5580287.1 hypothetical protein N7459_006272 [Penicillium hispanicum]